MADWYEVNILPASPKRWENLLRDALAPLVGDVAGNCLAGWFCFWEYGPVDMVHLRVRFRLTTGREDEATGAISDFLDACERDALLWRWWPGNHGIPGGTYTGEAAYYGSRLWESTWRYWMAGSKYALDLVLQDLDGTLERGRGDHLKRCWHLLADQIGYTYFGEAVVHLEMAARYVRVAAAHGDERASLRWARRLDRAGSRIRSQAMARAVADSPRRPR